MSLRQCISDDASLAPLALSFSKLRLGVDAPAAKRKGPCGHYGASNDSSFAVRLVALSRLMRVRDEPILDAAAQSPIGVAVLAELRALVLRVAVSVGGADPALMGVSIATLFNLSDISEIRDLCCFLGESWL